MDSTKFDDILMGILQHCEQVEPFLDSIFSFLARRTDFFRVMQNQDDKMGFPPEVAEKIVLKIFKTYQQIVLGSSGDLETAKNTSEAKKKKNKTGLTSPPLPETSAEESKVEVPSVSSTVEIEASSSDVQHEAPPSTAAVETVGETTAASTAIKPSSSSSENGARPLQESEVGKDTESQGLTPGKSDDCYNGAVLDTYTWSQSIRDIDVRIPVPSSVTKARDVGVEIKCSHLKVWLKKDRANEVILDGKLQRTIKCEDSMWTLEPGKCILVNLEKTEERFWTAVLEGDLEIDKTKVDTTRDISDFDEQTQSDFQRVMYDHHQKLQGKPTSQEVKTHELLKQAWNAKGSPFAGTEFDPSKVNISPSYG